MSFRNDDEIPADLKYSERRQRAEDTYNNIATDCILSPERFTEALSGDIGPGMGKLYGELTVKHNLWEVVVKLSSHHDPKVAFRSSWALDKAYFSLGKVPDGAPSLSGKDEGYDKHGNSNGLNNLGSISNLNRAGFALRFSPLLVEKYLETNNGSVLRSYGKILCDMLRRNFVNPDTGTLEKIAEKAFDTLIDPEVKVAVKVWAMEILYDLSPKFDWIDEHLEEVIKLQLEKTGTTPAMISHGKKVIARIRRRCK